MLQKTTKRYCRVHQIHLSDTILSMRTQHMQPRTPQTCHPGHRPYLTYLPLGTDLREKYFFCFIPNARRAASTPRKPPDDLPSWRWAALFMVWRNSYCCSVNVAPQIHLRSGKLEGICPRKINGFYQEQKDLNTSSSRNYLWGMYDTPIKKNPKHKFSLPLHIIQLFISFTKIKKNVGIFKRYGLPFPFL